MKNVNGYERVRDQPDAVAAQGQTGSICNSRRIDHADLMKNPVAYDDSRSPPLAALKLAHCEYLSPVPSSSTASRSPSCYWRSFALTVMPRRRQPQLQSAGAPPLCD